MARKLTKEEKIKRWADKQIKLYHELTKSCYLHDDEGNEICANIGNVGCAGIHLNRCIFTIAEALNIKVEERPFGASIDTDFNVEYYFVYNNVTFFELGAKGE